MGACQFARHPASTNDSEWINIPKVVFLLNMVKMHDKTEGTTLYYKKADFMTARKLSGSGTVLVYCELNAESKSVPYQDGDYEICRSSGMRTLVSAQDFVGKYMLESEFNDRFTIIDKKEVNLSSELSVS
jgi:hypothetical protein